MAKKKGGGFDGGFEKIKSRNGGRGYNKGEDLGRRRLPGARRPQDVYATPEQISERIGDLKAARELLESDPGNQELREEFGVGMDQMRNIIKSSNPAFSEEMIDRQIEGMIGRVQGQEKSGGPETEGNEAGAASPIEAAEIETITTAAPVEAGPLAAEREIDTEERVPQDLGAAAAQEETPTNVRGTARKARRAAQRAEKEEDESKKIEKEIDRNKALLFFDWLDAIKKARDKGLRPKEAKLNQDGQKRKKHLLEKLSLTREPIDEVESSARDFDASRGDFEAPRAALIEAYRKRDANLVNVRRAFFDILRQKIPVYVDNKQIEDEIDGVLGSVPRPVKVKGVHGEKMDGDKVKKKEQPIKNSGVQKFIEEFKLEVESLSEEEKKIFADSLKLELFNTIKYRRPDLGHEDHVPDKLINQLKGQLWVLGVEEEKIREITDEANTQRKQFADDNKKAGERIAKSKKFWEEFKSRFAEVKDQPLSRTKGQITDEMIKAGMAIRTLTTRLREGRMGDEETELLRKKVEAGKQGGRALGFDEDTIAVLSGSRGGININEKAVRAIIEQGINKKTARPALGTEPPAPDAGPPIQPPEPAVAKGIPGADKPPLVFDVKKPLSAREAEELRSVLSEAAEKVAELSPSEFGIAGVREKIEGAVAEDLAKARESIHRELAAELEKPNYARYTPETKAAILKDEISYQLELMRPAIEEKTRKRILGEN